MIINADNLVLGRMAAIAAKQALLGEDVRIVNCEKAIITGDKKSILKHYLQRLDIGQPQQGPFIQKRPDLFVRRTIRGMLPRRQSKGRDAFSRVKCYVGVPDKSEKADTLKKAQLQKITKRFITVGELCMHLGGKTK